MTGNISLIFTVRKRLPGNTPFFSSLFFCAVRSFAAVLCVLCACVCLSCSSGGTEAYIQGLKALDDGNSDVAASFFADGIQKSGYGSITGALCAEELLRTGSTASRLAVAKAFFKACPENVRARAVYAESLYDAGRFDDVIQHTESVVAGSLSRAPETSGDSKPTPEYDLLVRLYVQSCMQTGRDCTAECLNWFLSGKINGEHAAFYDFFRHKSLPELSATGAYAADIMKIRISVYRREYAVANETLFSLLHAQQSMERFLAGMPAPFLSDAGKIFLYSTDAYSYTAAMCSGAAAQCGSDAHDARFILLFYAARLYEKAGSGYLAQAAALYRQAMDAAPDGENYDNALWYYLSMTETQSGSIAGVLEHYAPLWHDAAYFSDILDNACVKLLGSRRLSEFYQVTALVCRYADRATAAKYAYICARLMQEQLLPKPSARTAAGWDAEIQAFFQTAYEKGASSLYYRLLSAEKLGISIADLYAENQADSVSQPAVLPGDAEFCALIDACFAHGMEKNILSLFMKCKEAVGRDTAVAVIRRLEAADSAQPELYAQSIRIAAEIFRGIDTASLPLDIVRLLYPQHFPAEIQKNAAQAGIPEYLLYGLVRSESFFNKDAVSHAGACGLCQLMKSTAADVARKQRLADFDLFNADDNCRLGAAYLSELTGRLGGSPVLALCAYNAGITTVRRWLRTAEWLPRDLFPEVIAYKETRGYCRNVTASAIMYGYLYDGKDIAEVTGEIFKH